MVMKLYNYTKFNESVDDIHALCKRYGIKNYTINLDGSIDVDDNVYLNGIKLTKIPIKFNRVSGDFECYKNQLESLKGCPKWLGGEFSCSNSHLTTLEGCPEYIGGDFYCIYNQLTDFRGFPEFYEGDVFFNGNPVYEIIKGIPYDKVCKFIHLLNEYSVIRPGMKIIKDRLEVAYDGIGEVMPENIEITGYEIV